MKCRPPQPSVTRWRTRRLFPSPGPGLFLPPITLTASLCLLTPSASCVAVLRRSQSSVTSLSPDLLIYVWSATPSEAFSAVNTDMRAGFPPALKISIVINLKIVSILLLPFWYINLSSDLKPEVLLSLINHEESWGIPLLILCCLRYNQVVFFFPPMTF